LSKKINSKKNSKISACFKAIRPYHAIKNGLLFIPLLVGHQYFNTIAIGNVFLGSIVFCLFASSAYLINDLADLKTDQQDIKKQKRPFASGTLPLNVGYIFSPLFALIALSFSIFLPYRFLMTALSYYSLTLIYTFFIKKIKWIDAFLLASLYSLRVFAGMTLIKNGFSWWLIFFVLSLFFSLALLKRYAELALLGLKNKFSIPGRAYQLNDKTRLAVLGRSSGILSILIFIFYIYSPKAQFFYSSPLLLWFICPCLFMWLHHMWQLAREGKIDDDPVVITVKDRLSWIFLIVIVFMTVLATGFHFPH